MRLIIYGLFLLTPVYLLNTLLLPELNRVMKYYVNADQIVEKRMSQDLENSRNFNR